MCQTLSAHLTSVLFMDTLLGKDYSPHFTDGHTKVHKGKATGSESHGSRG